MTAEDQDKELLVRFKEDHDNVEPAASSVAALNLLRLAQFTDNPAYREKAAKTLQAFGSTLRDSPRAMPYMLCALDYAVTDPKQVVIAGQKNATDTKALLKVLHDSYIPVKIVVLAESGGQGVLKPFQAMKPIGGKATAYLCEHYVCKKPTSDPKEFENLLTR